MESSIIVLFWRREEADQDDTMRWTKTKLRIDGEMYSMQLFSVMCIRLENKQWNNSRKIVT